VLIDSTLFIPWLDPTTIEREQEAVWIQKSREKISLLDIDILWAGGIQITSKLSCVFEQINNSITETLHMHTLLQNHQPWQSNYK